MSDKHRSEGHEITGLDNENKNRFSNATSKFHGRSGQARVNSQSNPTTGRTCWICSSAKHYDRVCHQSMHQKPMQLSWTEILYIFVVLFLIIHGLFFIVPRAPGSRGVNVP